MYILLGAGWIQSSLAPTHVLYYCFFHRYVSRSSGLCAYIATFIKHIQILVLVRRKKLPTKTFIYLSTASFLLFVTATVAVVANLTFATSIFKGSAEPIDFSKFSKTRNIGIGCIVVVLMISDAFLLYRSYILYNCQPFVVFLPLLVLVTEFGVGLWSIISLPQKNGVDPWTDHQPKSLSSAETIFGFISFAVNVMCTGLIIARLWRSHRQLSASGVINLQSPRTYVQVGVIIINSAAINLVWMWCVFVSSTTSSVVYEVFGNSFACVTALIFSTTIVSASNAPSSESSAPGTKLHFRPRSSVELSSLGKADKQVAPEEV
ncbi:hypothetical protein BDP27DRAFT_1455166 [Rhodocollybia butyracea]|uniref:Uncharacterized protein n=1 Tax=Rhodocollybia butyracea TaxID=206335 RepID=A0A9P5P6Y6_9AGAR|nr:hypothetical protein BDP27DRAFT_1455166 [Rhodocollybia butyracea]